MGIRIIGTSHIAQQSADAIRAAVEKHRPDIIALELDQQRLKALHEGEQTRVPLSAIRQIGFLGYLFAVIGSYLQRKLGNVVGTKPGVEMLTAFQVAAANDIQVYLIDQDLRITMAKLSGSVTAREKLRLLWDIVTAPFRREKVKFNLAEVPEDAMIQDILKQFQHRYPMMHHILVTERNKVMVHNLQQLQAMDETKNILAVVGAGHEQHMKEMLGKHNTEEE